MYSIYVTFLNNPENTIKYVTDYTSIINLYCKDKNILSIKNCNGDYIKYKDVIDTRAIITK